MPAQDRQNVTIMCLLVKPETSAEVAKQLMSIHHDFHQVGQQHHHIQSTVWFQW